MDRSIFDQMETAQSSHWWFVGRRHVLSSVIGSLHIPASARILEIGAGTGANLQMLSEFGDVVGVEADEQARTFCVEHGWNVLGGYLPDGLSNVDGKFDLICLFDVLEHIEFDEISISSLIGRLNPGGTIIIACPAYNWLFGEYDAALGHYRRYTSKSLSELVKRAGFVVERKGYFNTILFPLIVAGRFAEIIGQDTRKNALSLPPRILNWILTFLFSLESLITDRFLLPFGSTVVACGRLPERA